MPDIVIADTSCFILFANINELELLHKVYKQVIATSEIANEFGEPLPEWVKIISATNNYTEELLEIQIDKGESSAIALALEMPGSLLILDDYKARKIAMQLKINLTGTIGVIIKAKLNGIIPSIKPLLKKIKQTDFRISDEIELQALIEAHENLDD